MNPEQLLNEVQKAIEQRPASKHKTCDLGFFKGEIRCFPRRQQPTGFTPIVKVSGNNLIHGFTSDEWSDLSKRLWPYYERSHKCQKHPKP